MKPLSLLTAALVVTGGITTLSVDRYPLLGGTLIPRGRGNDALEPHKGGSRGGLNRDKADPPYKAPHSRQDVKRAEDTIRKGPSVKVPDAKDRQRSKTPPEGVDAYVYKKDDNVAKVYLGNALEVPSRMTEMRERHDPSEKEYEYQPRPHNKEERKAADHQRRDAYRSLPAHRGMVNDHKGPMSSHYAKDGQVASVAIDNQRSQNFEGQLIKAANEPVIQNGYRDPRDSSTWKGKGGVVLVPNAKTKAPLRPEIGPPESKPHKYSVEEDSDYEIKPKKRTRGSRSSSDDSLTLQVKPQKKTSRHSQNRRDGVSAITSKEASASTANSSPQNSTSETPEELQAYLDAWDIVRSNATDILWPFIVDMLEGTNSSAVITAAWSVYSDMIPTPYVVMGPFLYGWTSLFTQEEAWAQSGNISNATLAELYAVNDVLIDLYSTAWDGGFEALNSTGVLYNLNWLGETIMAYNTSLPVGPINDPDVPDPYADFFLSYFSIVPDDELDLNSTVSSYPTTSGTAVPSAAFYNSMVGGGPYPNATQA